MGRFPSAAWIALLLFAGACGPAKDGNEGSEDHSASNPFLDGSFGQDGMVRVFDGLPSPRITSLILDDADRILVAAELVEGEGANDGAVVRLLPSGRLDASLQTERHTGAVRFHPSTVDILVDPARAIVGAGTVPGFLSEPSRAFVLRLGSDGAPDETFGVEGRLVLSTNGRADAIAAAPDGGYFVGMMEPMPDDADMYAATLRHVSRTGAVERTAQVPNGGYIRHLACGPGSSVIAAGGAAYPFLARFLADGAPDPAFGAGGFVFGEESQYSWHELMVQPDGKAVVYGRRFVTDQIPFLRRYDTDGSVDVTFGAGGDAVAPDFASTVTADERGRLVFAGIAPVDGQPGFRLERWTRDGLPDETFGDGGAIDIAVDGSPWSTEIELAIDSDGRILAAGGLWLESGGRPVLRILPERSLRR